MPFRLPIESESSQDRRTSFSLLMQQVEHITCFSRAYLRDYRICEFPFEELFTYCAYLTSIDEEAFTIVRILFHLDFLHILLCFELCNRQSFNEL